MNLSNVKGKINTARIFKSKGIGLGNKSVINKDRLPPNQRLLNNPNDFPVLDLGYIPEFNEETYRFKVFGEVDNPIELTFDELINNFKKKNYKLDFHCVTKWSKYDLNWSGISFLDLLNYVKPNINAKYIIQYGLDGYTTNVVLDELKNDNVLLAYELNGEYITSEHGFPLRLIIPKLYAWKGSKFLTALEFSCIDKKGFWEVRGYHNHGDPWLEERYS